MEFTYEGMALIPVIIIVVNLIKRTGVPTKFLPFIAMAIGIIFGFVFIAEGDLRKGFLAGMIMGTSASGFYSNGKEVIKGVKGIQESNKRK